MTEEISKDMSMVDDGSNKMFNTVNALDPVLQVKNSINYPVVRGGSSIIHQTYKATSATPTNVQFQCLIPNLSTIIDRHAVLKLRSIYTISATMNSSAAKAAGDFSLITDGFFQWGKTLGLAPWAANSLITNCNVTINNHPLTQNTCELVQFIERCMDKEVLSHSANEAPCTLDRYASYDSGVTFTAGAGGANGVYSSNQCNVLGDGSLAGNMNGERPRGSFPVSIVDNKSVVLGGAGASPVSIVITIDHIEPLLLSPFLVGSQKHSENGYGFYGIQQMNFDIGLSSQIVPLKVCPSVATFANVTKADWSYAAGSLSFALTNVLAPGCEIELKFYQPPLSTKYIMPSRNVVPFTKLERMTKLQGSITTVTTYTPGSDVAVAQRCISDTEQITKVPNYLMIGVRKQWNRQTPADSRSFLPLHNLSLTFNGQSNILSTWSVRQLWEASVRNGLNATYDEYFGWTWQNGGIVATSGAPLILEFGRDIPLSGFSAPGVMGSYNIQVDAGVVNNTGGTVPDQTYELVVVYVYEGFLINELSTTTQALGPLNQTDVEKAAEKEITAAYHDTLMYGGGKHQVKGVMRMPPRAPEPKRMMGEGKVIGGGALERARRY